MDRIEDVEKEELYDKTNIQRAVYIRARSG